MSTSGLVLKNNSLLAAGFFSEGHLDTRAYTSVQSSRTQKSGMAVWPSREEGETRKNRLHTLFNFSKPPSAQQRST